MSEKTNSGRKVFPVSNTPRHVELEKMLEERRVLILGEVGRQVSAVDFLTKRVRVDQAKSSIVVLDPSTGEPQTTGFNLDEDIEFALIRMKAETLEKITEAIAKLKEDKYGTCAECGDPIAEARLKVLPFAVRCKPCEEEREVAIQRERVFAHRLNLGRKK